MSELSYKNDIVKKLNEIGIALSVEKDTDKLLELILKESMIITHSDAGSLYIVDEHEKEKFLKFKIAKNESRKIKFQEVEMPLNQNSFAGYSASTGQALNIENVEEYAKAHNITYNKKFEDELDYKSVKMLVVPMKNYKQEVVGVVQLINKKESNESKLGDKDSITSQVFDYSRYEQDLVSSLTSQASILLERTKLYNDIEELFSSFVETMVFTIDARDTTTSGHSRRLAGYALKFAEIINKVDYGKYKNLSFSKEEIKELYYAALLHDIGKIGVREDVLLKRHRLTDDRMKIIHYKFEMLRKSLEFKEITSGLSEDEFNIFSKIKEFYEFINEINKRGYITEDETKKLYNIAKIKIIDFNGEEAPLLDQFELENLSIKKGNLTDYEKDEMNYHVVYSFDILQKVNWLKSLENVPTIAGLHHEKVDGSGYPNGFGDEKIPVQAKIITILDIFEALTARDRVYKPPMPVEKAISILKAEVDDTHLDKDLFEIFIKENIYELYKEELDKIVKL